MPRSSSARVRVALALACALHALSLAAVYAWPWRGKLERPLAPVAIVEDDIELEIEAELLPAPAPAATPSFAASELDTPARLTRSMPLRAAPRELSAGDDSSQAPPDADGESSQRDEAPEAPPDRAVDLGLGPDAWRKWARLGQTETDAKPKRRKRTGAGAFHAPPVSTTGGLLEGLEAHDRQLGLGPSGPVIGALYRAAHTPDAPQTGVARFEVTVLKTGVVEVALLGASDRSAAWAKVGALAAEAIRKAPPAIAEPRSGTRIVIAVVAEEVFPNGTKRGQLSGPHLEGVGAKLRSTSDAKAKLEELNPVTEATRDPVSGAPVNGVPLILEVPGVYVAGRGAVCSYRIGISVLGPMLDGGCDLANVGSKAQRMVRTQVEEQAMF